MKIIFLKIAKNMGTTVKSILRTNEGYYGEIPFFRKIDEKKLRASKYVTLIHKSTISSFKEAFPDIWDNALKLVIFREPLDRLHSCYNYMRNKKRSFNESYTDVIKEMERRKGINSATFDLNWKTYDSFHIHLYSSQLELIDCNPYNTSNEDYKWLKMDDGNYVLNEISKLGIDNVNSLMKNKTKRKRFYPQKEDVEKYKQVFEDDFLAYNLINNENSSHN